MNLLSNATPWGAAPQACDCFDMLLLGAMDGFMNMLKIQYKCLFQEFRHVAAALLGKVLT